MADIRDERGNPIQLTDEHGNPVQLTDEYGKPMHLTGVAVSTDVGAGAEGTTHTAAPTGGSHSTPSDDAKAGAGAVAGAGGDALGAAAGVGHAAKETVTGHEAGEHQEKQMERSSSSSSGSSEEDEQGGRRKKKGLTQKIKEKLTGKHKEEPVQEGQHAHSFTTEISSTTAPGQPHDPETIRVEHHEHEKKGMMEKIKEKLPGHHH